MAHITCVSPVKSVEPCVCVCIPACVSTLYLSISLLFSSPRSFLSSTHPSLPSSLSLSIPPSTTSVLTLIPFLPPSLPPPLPPLPSSSLFLFSLPPQPSFPPLTIPASTQRDKEGTPVRCCPRNGTAVIPSPALELRTPTGNGRDALSSAISLWGCCT